MGCYYVTKPMAQLLITGGAGFIGNHTAVNLLKAGHERLADRLPALFQPS